MPIRFLHSPVTLRNRRNCFLSHLVLGEGVTYAYTVPALTSDPAYMSIFFLSQLVLGEGISYAYPVPALTSDLGYPAILFPEQFVPGTGC